MKREIKQSFDGQLYQEHSYQNLLKLDHFSSGYDEKNFAVFYAPQCTYVHLEPWKMWHFAFVAIFADYWPIFKILSLAHFADNLQ